MATKTATQEKYDQLLRDHVRPLLKSHGFKHVGANFRRRWSDGWHVVNFQKTMYGTRDATKFTINAGVSCDIVSRYKGEDPAKPPTEPECHLRTRVGSLRPDGCDYWIELDDSVKLDRLANEVTTHLRELILPAFEKMSSLHQLKVETGLSGPGPWDFYPPKPLFRACLVRDNPAELAAAVEQLRREHTGPSPHVAHFVESSIRRLHEKW